VVKHNDIQNTVRVWLYVCTACLVKLKLCPSIGYFHPFICLYWITTASAFSAYALWWMTDFVHLGECDRKIRSSVCTDRFWFCGI